MTDPADGDRPPARPGDGGGEEPREGAGPRDDAEERLAAGPGDGGGGGGDSGGSSGIGTDDGLLAARPGDRPHGPAWSTRSPVLGRHGMVCTSQPLASAAGHDVLRDGGSAVDAALAANAVLALVEPTGCGLGGDLFAQVWDPQLGRLQALDGSGRSPAGLSLQDLRARLGPGQALIPDRGALAVSVPGCVDGWCTLHERFGRLSLARVLEPAIGLALEGAPITQTIAGEWARSRERLADVPGFAATFLPGGRAPAEGQPFRNPGLARTLELVAARGRQAFYEGELARDLVAWVQAAGGALSLEDLARHRSDWVTPLSIRWRGHELWELPPPGQGLAALQMLGLLGDTPLPWDDPLSWHRAIEAKKLAYEDRARFYGDPAFVDLDPARLLDEDYLAGRRALLDDDQASQRPAPGVLSQGDTVYLTAADDRGQVVSWIQSNYMGFGTGLVPPGRGFSLQNRGALFSLDPSHASVYAPGKRPFHTIIPALLTRGGRPVFSFGVMGGDMQPQGHVQILAHVLDDGMDVQSAGDAPRWRHEGSSCPSGRPAEGAGVVHLETGVPEHVVADLRRRGHEVRVGPGGFGGYQGLWIDELSDGGRLYRGASECRKDGLALGS